jgi:hypothetical protein
MGDGWPKEEERVEDPNEVGKGSEKSDEVE